MKNIILIIAILLIGVHPKVVAEDMFSDKEPAGVEEVNQFLSKLRKGVVENLIILPVDDFEDTVTNDKSRIIHEKQVSVFFNNLTVSSVHLKPLPKGDVSLYMIIPLLKKAPTSGLSFGLVSSNAGVYLMYDGVHFSLSEKTVKHLAKLGVFYRKGERQAKP